MHASTMPVSAPACVHLPKCKKMSPCMKRPRQICLTITGLIPSRHRDVSRPLAYHTSEDAAKRAQVETSQSRAGQGRVVAEVSQKGARGSQHWHWTGKNTTQHNNTTTHSLRNHKQPKYNNNTFGITSSSSRVYLCVHVPLSTYSS